MRKIITALIAGVLAISLSGCIPSGNIVGKSQFETTYSSGFADVGQTANVEINGGVVATPKGLKFRVNKANLLVNGTSFVAPPGSFFEPIDYWTKSDFAYSRLKGKNICGALGGFTSGGLPFAVILTQVSGDRQQLQILAEDGFEWVGTAPANSLKIGGRNLCGSI